ncbi:MAG: VCBS repeat-containing protein [Rhodospirillales bacterium]|nr:VCBS repeat-containing protein [Rhodospirillales bacterium]
MALELDPNSVFEDRYPRIHDLDGDGDSEIIVVKSYLDNGAALAVIDVVEGTLQIVAETPPIGIPDRWLNPVGAADFDGDGFTEIAVVKTPHIGGILTLYRWKDKKLSKAYRAKGFSNHTIGSRELGLSAILDVNNDGIPDIAAPNASRDALRIVTFADGQFLELANIPSHARIASPMTSKRTPKQWRIVYGLEDGTGVAITPLP